MTQSYYDLLQPIAKQDAETLKERDRTYGSSWKQRGGIGAFMMLARKWDRIENQLKNAKGVDKYDIFEFILQNPAEEGILDDVVDLRRYLLLVEAEIRFRQKQKEVNVNVQTGPAHGKDVHVRPLEKDNTGIQQPYGYQGEE